MLPAASCTQVVPQRSVLDALLLGEWEDRAEAGLFRYDVTACPTKLVPGSFGFIAQCNEGRLSKKRPTEFRIDQVRVAACFVRGRAHVCVAAGPGGRGRRLGPVGQRAASTRAAQVAQDFDGGKFNFTKALQQEVLFMFEPAPGRGAKPSFRPAAPPRASPNLVYINVSPIEYGHVLLVPRALDSLRQLVTPDTMLLALQFAREAGECGGGAGLAGQLGRARGGPQSPDLACPPQTTPTSGWPSTPWARTVPSTTSTSRPTT